ncbi:Transcription factor [Penicillium griseofulvum]|uniref:Transcription factor n=1 Tax=Penicillium patulum TaxID=5078 RepID=A0A135LMY2_PENPA|nr:Transcription factor [Penicillium griseofulvum]KXG50316.1 Transcription factor [Penicillium griseofulvum]
MHGRSCTYLPKSVDRKSQKRAVRDVAMEGRRVSTRSLNQQSSGGPEEKQTIQINQVGHLKTSDDVRLRYFSSSSWVAGFEESNVSPCDCNDALSPALNGKEISPGTSPRTSNDFIYLAEVDQLISWYAEHCHFWFPLVDWNEVIAAVHEQRNHGSSKPGALALIAAICYTATRSIKASGSNSSWCLFPSSFWEEVTVQLLAESGYPRRPNLNTVRVAFFLAIPSMAEGHSHPNPSSVSILVRAAQFLGLHREPLSFQLSAHDAEVSRVIWWSVRGLDVTYAISHGLPPLIHPTTTDVRSVDCEYDSERKLLSAVAQTSALISKILHRIYSVSQPTLHHIKQLDDEAERIYAEEVSDDYNLQKNAMERFVAMGRLMCCCKMMIILHQPYLRTSQWPQGSRLKALKSCQDYIRGFVTGATDEALAPYRWVLSHFDVIHACAIILQDLIQNCRSPESSSLRDVVDICFSTFSKGRHPAWTKLELLRSKAWAANGWPVNSQAREMMESDASLADYDPLFASFLWEELLV